MNTNEYQKLAARTLIDRPDFEIADNDMMIVWNALGLAGEAGEVVDQIKKGILHQHGLDRDKMKKELGDVCWYVAALCTKLDLDLGEVFEANIDKLKKRYPDGYKPADSMKRIDTETPGLAPGTEIKTAEPILDWDKASNRLEAATLKYINDDANLDVLACDMPYHTIGKRFFAGERTPELYAAMMAVE